MGLGFRGLGFRVYRGLGFRVPRGVYVFPCFGQVV